MVVRPDSPPVSAGRRRLDGLFSVDLRSLAVLRVGLAGAVLVDVLDRSRDLVAHYTEHGVLPVAALAAQWGSAAWASPLAWLSGSPALVGVSLAVLALSAVALGLGWRTRWAAVLCWLLLVLFQARNPFVSAMGGDRLLRLVLLWSLFLPLGARFSLDARRQETAPDNRLMCLPGAALLLQVALMYWTTGALKNGATWLDGSAVSYVLNLDYWVTPLGAWLRDWPTLHPAATHGTRWFELLGPFLAFLPFATGPSRTMAIALFTGFHLGLAACLSIGPFPLFSIVAWTAFLPSWFWDELLPRLGFGPGPCTLRKDQAARRPARVPPWAQAAAAALFLFAVVDMGARSAGSALPSPLPELARLLRIRQSWGMFAPDPPSREVWLAFHGSLADGGTVDPLRGGPPLKEKPELVSRSFPSFRWRLYLAWLGTASIKEDPPQRLLDELAAFLCRDWNQRHEGGEQLVGVDAVAWVEENRALETPAAPRTVHRGRCGGTPQTRDPAVAPR